MIATTKEGQGGIERSLLLTKKQVSVMLAVPVSTVGNLHRYGTLLGRRVGRELRWHPGVVAAYVKRLEEETS